jgi:hypothetical protein
MEEIIGGVISEADVGAEKYLIENRSAEKTRHLLFFDDLAREGQSMTAAGEDEAGDATVDGSEESEFAFFEIDLHIAAAKLNAVGGDKLVGGSGVETQGVERVIEFARRLIGGRKDGRRDKTRQSKKRRCCPHARSVVTFGMAEQGREERESKED